MIIKALEELNHGISLLLIVFFWGYLALFAGYIQFMGTWFGNDEDDDDD